MTTDMTRKPTRRPFYLALALFFSPLVIAFAIYYGSSWRPSGGTNKGELMNPAIPLPAVTLSTADASATPASFLRNVWTLVYVGDGACDDTCRKSLANMQLARQLLGKDMTRTGRVFLFTGACCDAALHAADPELTSARVDDAAGQSLLAAFPVVQGQNALQAQRVYIVDPLGNLMMSYKPGTDPRDIYQDMKKLLTLSHIG